MSYIITEMGEIRSIPQNVKTIGKNKIRFNAILQDVNTVNRNRRRYGKEIVTECVDRMKPRINEGSLLGELDHPISDSPIRQMTVLYKESSHRFLEMGWDGNKLVGVLESLRTPNGKILKNLAEDSVDIGFSFRGMGDLRQVTENGQTFNEVVGPLNGITWDAVSYPSHAVAKLTEITEGVIHSLHESVGVDYVEENGFVKTDEGYCYVPNDFDRLVEQRIIKLKEKFYV